jgi:hypothetical protein
MLMTPISPYVIASPSAASSRMLPRLTPETPGRSFRRLQASIDRAQRQFGFGTYVGIGFGELDAFFLEQRQQQSLRVRIAALRERANRTDARRLVVARELDRRARAASAAP